eukprot:TRINITY_DN3302_c0_g3_i1.p1 TRINITY_DN3302_c0_g3~~TRINITY_DN3302_c0_g3_i1.p1  ORF type:complete len:130 (+),score=7.55 TRINITY_DN3302_c0_g3_i1:31-420(+)
MLLKCGGLLPHSTGYSCLSRMRASTNSGIFPREMFLGRNWRFTFPSEGLCVRNMHIHGCCPASKDSGPHCSDWVPAHANESTKFIAKSEALTECLAEAAADLVEIGDVLCLRGPVGAGKSVFRSAASNM